jgi:glycosyltransferase involved in cell wall biosynthesis
LFISSYLKRKIKAFNPDIIYYLPTAHATIYSFLRAKVLNFYGSGARTILVTLQPRHYSTIVKKVIPFILPDLVFAQSIKTLKALSSLGCQVKKIPAGVDLQKFNPVDEITKKTLRKKYGFPDDKSIVLHVGHINRNRNTHFLDQIQPLDEVQAVVVGSSTYPEDVNLVEDLKGKGVIIITDYLEKIEELYQCADCYLFPVFSDGACIEVPLSVFEAMACNIPIVTTKYGDLPNLIKEQGGFMYAETTGEIIAKVKSLKRNGDPNTRELVEHFAWTNVVKNILADSLAG